MKNSWTYGKYSAPFKGSLKNSPRKLNAFYRHSSYYLIQPLPNNKVLDSSKMEAFESDKLKVVWKIEICFFEG